MIFILIMSILIMSGWFCPFLEPMTYLYKEWPSMKLFTAFLFFLLSSSHLSKKELGASFSIVGLISLYSFLNDSFPFSNFIEALSDKDTMVKTIRRGHPSIGTIFCFAILFLENLLFDLGVFKGRRYLSIMVILLSSFALIGYLLNSPKLYFYLKGVSTGMAIHTASFFLYSGSVRIFKKVKE
jgi:hypothetical protein